MSASLGTSVNLTIAVVRGSSGPVEHPTVRTARIRNSERTEISRWGLGTLGSDAQPSFKCRAHPANAPANEEAPGIRGLGMLDRVFRLAGGIAAVPGDRLRRSADRKSVV